jgi:hypothetical protein
LSIRSVAGLICSVGRDRHLDGSGMRIESSGNDHEPRRSQTHG